MSGWPETSLSTAEKQVTVRWAHTQQPTFRVQSPRRPADRGVIRKPKQARPRQAHTQTLLSQVVALENVGLAGEKDTQDATLPGPRTLLDQGRNDPFTAWNVDSDFPPMFVSQTLDHIRGELALLVPRGANGDAFADAVLAMAVSNKALIYSMLNVGLAYTRARAGRGANKSALETLAASRTVKALNEQISDPSTAATVANIWTVGSVAFFDELEQVRVGRVPRQSPLKDWQTFPVHGRAVHNLVQYRGFMQLIEMGGGLQAIQQPGVGACLSYVTLCSSTVNSQRHYSTFIPHSTGHLDDNGRLALTQDERTWAHPTLGRLGTSFAKVWKGDHGRPVSDLLSAVQHMSDFVVVLEAYLDGRDSERTPAVMIDQLNFTHHTLMSLYSADEFEAATGNLADELYEPCRLACTIFSLLVIFPTPPTMSLYARTISRLQCSLGKVKFDAAEISARDGLHAWILAMGAIFTIGLPERDDFVAELTQLLDGLEIRAFRGFKTLLEGFLWHPKTNEIDGMELWRDVQLVRKRVTDV